MDGKKRKRVVSEGVKSDTSGWTGSDSEDGVKSQSSATVTKRAAIDRSDSLVWGGMKHKSRYIYHWGNYQHYYSGYRDRISSVTEMDPRLHELCRWDKDFFKDKTVLDIGCNVGLITFCIAALLQPSKVVGVDVDASLITNALKSLRLAKWKGWKTRVTSTSTSDNVSWPQSFKHSPHDRRVLPCSQPLLWCEAPPSIVAELQGILSGTMNNTEEGVAAGMFGGGFSAASPLTLPPPALEEVVVEDGEKKAQDELEEETLIRDQESKQADLYEDAFVSTLALPVSRRFPYNVEFRAENFNLSDIEERRGEQFDIVMVLSVTKWIHINMGDEGLRNFFVKIYQLLGHEGFLVLEPQAWTSYKKFNTFPSPYRERKRKLALRPSLFDDYLTRQVGFTKHSSINPPSRKGGNKGFERPLLIYQKICPMASVKSPVTAYSPYRSCMPFRGSSS